MGQSAVVRWGVKGLEVLSSQVVEWVTAVVVGVKGLEVLVTGSRVRSAVVRWVVKGLEVQFRHR